MGQKAKRAKRQALKDQVSGFFSGADTSQIESTAQDATKTLTDAIATSAGQIAGEIKGGIENITQKVDAFKGELSNLTVEGLIDKGAQSLENMATDFVSNKINSLLSKFGSNVSISFSEPDSNGIVVPIASSLLPEGGVSDTLSSIIQLITGLGLNALEGLTEGALQKAVIDASPEGLIASGKEMLSGKLGAFSSADAFKKFVNDGITQVTDKLTESVVGTIQDINTTIDAVATIAMDGTFTRSPITGTGPAALDEFNAAIDNIKENAKADLDSIVTKASEVKQNLTTAKSDLENLTSGKDPETVLTAVETAPAQRAKYASKVDNYRSLIRTRAAKNSQNGIVQGISIETLTEVKKDLKAFAPRLTGDQINNVISLCQGNQADFNQAVDIVTEASGKSRGEVRAFLKTIDTTIYNSTRPELDDVVFPDPYVIGSFEKNWKNGAGNPLFPYISSREELQAEFRNIKREVTELVVHWTETPTNKNIGSEELNDLHIAFGLDGLGYHYVIRRDGTLQRGRPVNIVGQHSPTNNHDERSIGIVFVGGINAPSGTPNLDSFISAQSLTRSQLNTFDHMCRAFYAVFPGGQIIGHSEIDEDEFDPGFSVTEYVNIHFGKISKFKTPFTQQPFTVDEILKND
jgi:N-acetylmuramoyl-L-alanine amidase